MCCVATVALFVHVPRKDSTQIVIRNIPQVYQFVPVVCPTYSANFINICLYVNINIDI